MGITTSATKPILKRRFTDATDERDSSIGNQVTITGEFRGATNLEMRGRLEGDLEVDGLIWLRKGGHIVGSLAASDVVVEGLIDGNIRASGKVELRASCRVVGDINAGSVAVAEGGFFEGKITMAGDATDPVTFKEKRSRAAVD